MNLSALACYVTLKMPPFCHAIFSTVSPSRLVWSMPREETPHTTGFLKETGRSQCRVTSAGFGLSPCRAASSSLLHSSCLTYLIMLVQSKAPPMPTSTTARSTCRRADSTQGAGSPSTHHLLPKDSDTGARKDTHLLLEEDMEGHEREEAEVGGHGTVAAILHTGTSQGPEPHTPYPAPGRWALASPLAIAP